MLENTDQKNSEYGYFSQNVTFSDINLQKWTLTGDTMVISQAEMRKGEWVQGVERYEGDL